LPSIIPEAEAFSKLTGDRRDTHMVTTHALDWKGYWSDIDFYCSTYQRRHDYGLNKLLNMKPLDVDNKEDLVDLPKERAAGIPTHQ